MPGPGATCGSLCGRSASTSPRRLDNRRLSDKAGPCSVQAHHCSFTPSPVFLATNTSTPPFLQLPNLRLPPSRPWLPRGSSSQPKKGRKRWRRWSRRSQRRQGAEAGPAFPLGPDALHGRRSGSWPQHLWDGHDSWSWAAWRSRARQSARPLSLGGCPHGGGRARVCRGAAPPTLQLAPGSRLLSEDDGGRRASGPVAAGGRLLQRPLLGGGSEDDGSPRSVKSEDEDSD